MIDEHYLNQLYKQNLAISFYLAITFIALFILVYLNLSFYHKLISGNEPLSNKEIEKRYQVNLLRQNEREQTVIRNDNANNLKATNPQNLSEKHAQSTGLTQSQMADNPGLKQSLVDQFERKKTDARESSELLKRQNLSESIFGKQIQKNKSEKKNELTGKSFQTEMSSKSRSKGAERIGADITLNTYAWNYAPYIEIIRERIYKYISLPSGYKLGLLRGITYAKIVISLEGKKRFIKILDHQGNEILAKTSEDVLHAIFDLPKLPPDFPETELEIGIRFLYNVEMQVP